jgi:hypothetical protein
MDVLRWDERTLPRAFPESEALAHCGKRQDPGPLRTRLDQ